MALLNLAYKHAASDFGEGPGNRTPITAELSPARRFGPYTLVRHLATGGMAELHLARLADGDADSLVVLKRMRPELAGEADLVRMFLDEATIAASLQHPNIAGISDVGRANGDFFFAMEYLRGANVRQLLRRLGRTGRPLPLQHALSIVIGACAGLHHAHEMRDDSGEPLHIVHRDVSPHNIFVTYQGVPKVVDFGIAKASLRFSRTRPGSLKGKLHYMSPEQCQSQPLDRRSDVFSLCIVLWELTTGTRLYRGGSELEILKAIVDSDARLPSSVRPEYAAGLERITLRGLRRDPADRYATAAELQRDLEAFAATTNLDVSEVALSRFMRDVFTDEAGIDELGHHTPRASSMSELDDGEDLECVVIDTKDPGARVEPFTEDLITDDVAPLSFRRGTPLAVPLLLGAAIGGLLVWLISLGATP